MLKKKKELGELLKRKRKEAAKKEMAEMKKTKTESEIWKYINRDRKKRATASNNISMEK